MIRGFAVAQLNLALPRAPTDTPLMAEFMAALDPVNAIADRFPGFLWRLQDEAGNATAIRPFDDERMIVNMSVWESIDQLAAFIYAGEHLEVMRRRREWFEHIRMHMVLWWILAGTTPSLAEPRERFEHLEAHGPTPLAFTFKSRFTPETHELETDEEMGCPA